MTSTIKVNNIQNQCGANIINESSNTITIGASGDTVSLASGASQTGFGRTGTVDWDTTPKTATFSAVSGDGFFCNTTSSAFTCNLPAGSAGAIVSLADYAGTWQTNNLTVSPNGSDKIGGFNADAVLSTEGQSVTFVYVDSTQGWVNVQDSTSNERGQSYVTATGGTITTCGNFKVHTFTGPGTFTVTCAGNPAGSDTVDYLVVAGGGGGGRDDFGTYPTQRNGSGGGGGGFRLSNFYGIPAPTMSPLSNPTGITVTATGYPITVGGGGSGGTADPSGPGAPQTGDRGSNSVFSTITSTGGGGGLGHSPGPPSGGPAPDIAGPGGKANGGSGGGSLASNYKGSGEVIGTGNIPPVSPPQGNPGGTSGNPPNFGGAGGGGAGAAGTDTPGPGGTGAVGGIGSFVSPLMAGSNGEGSGPVSCTQYFAAGGGAWPANAGGIGGGGNGGGHPQTTAGSVNTGGGAGGNRLGNGGAGGSGIVIIRYKFQ